MAQLQNERVLIVDADGRIYGIICPSCGKAHVFRIPYEDVVERSRGTFEEGFADAT